MEFKLISKKVKVKPAPMLMFNGALPLKAMVQVCLCVEILQSLTFSSLFLVLETSVWLPMLLVFWLQVVLPVY